MENIDRDAEVLNPIEAVHPVEVLLNEPETEPTPEPTAVPNRTIPQPALHVSFVGNTPKGKQRHGRVFIQGMFALESQEQINQVEVLIGQNRGLDRVEVLGWTLVAA